MAIVSGANCPLGQGLLIWLTIVSVLLTATSTVMFVRATLAERKCREYANRYCSLRRLHDQVVSNQSWFEGEAARLRRELQALAGNWPLPGAGFPVPKRTEIPEDVFAIGDDGSESDEGDNRATSVETTDNCHACSHNAHAPTRGLAEADNMGTCDQREPASLSNPRRDRDVSPLPTYRTLMDELRTAVDFESDETPHKARADEGEVGGSYWGGGLAASDLGASTGSRRVPNQCQDDEEGPVKEPVGGEEGDGVPKSANSGPFSSSTAHTRRLC